MWTNSWRALQRGCAADVLELRQLNQFFFQDLNFGGNVNDYYDLTIASRACCDGAHSITLTVLAFELATGGVWNAEVLVSRGVMVKSSAAQAKSLTRSTASH
jgi:hypothetical protein